MVRYLLPESTVVIDGAVDLVVDSRLGEQDVRQYLGEPTATVAQSVRGDSSHGVRELVPPRRGDTTWDAALTGDQRLTGVGFNSVGVGSKVLGAGVKLLALVIGAAARSAAPAAMLRFLQAAPGSDDRQDSSTPPDEVEVRHLWESTHDELVTHQKAYADMADSATASLLRLRQESLGTDDPAAAARSARRQQQLTGLLSDALAESAKVEGLYQAWCEARVTRYPLRTAFTLAIDELPQHLDPSSFVVQKAQEADHTRHELWQRIWDDLGVRVEIGPTPTDRQWRPNPTGTVQTGPSEQAVHWRTPRAARLWIWRRSKGDVPVLEQVLDTLVTDRYSTSGSLELTGRSWGESSVRIALDDLGTPTKVEVGEKSAVGAFADAIAAAPEQFVAGLDAVTKASTALGDLSSAQAEQRLKVIKRQVEQRTQELEALGLNATADSFADLKRLKQQVEIASAQTSLAAPSDLAKLQDELAQLTARRDIEAVGRERAQAAELAATRSEIERLNAELELLKLRGRADPGEPSTTGP